MSRIPIIKFNGGLVTPLVDARIDDESYQASCRVLNNFIARMYGAAERRPGTYYIGGMRSSDDTIPVSGVTKCLLVPFIYSETIAYVLEFTAYYMRVYYHDAVVDEVATSYLEDDLFELQFDQVGDVIWITHREYQQIMLKRVTATDFILEEVESNYGPFLKRNDLAIKDGKEMTLTGSGLTLTNSSDTTYDASVNSNTAYKAFDQNTITYWSYSNDDSWISCQWDEAKTVVRVKMFAYRVRYFMVQGSDDGSAWVNVEASAWSGGCKEYEMGGESHTEISSYHAGWCDITLDNEVGYEYWRILILGSYDTGNARFIREIQMSETDISADDDTAVLVCSDDHFDANHVGALFALTQPRVNCSISVNKTSTGYTDEILIEGAAVLSIAAGWKATVILERKQMDETEWETVSQWVSYDGLRAIQYSVFEEDFNVYYRVNIYAYTSGTISGELTVNESTHTGICKVIEYVDATTVNVDIVKDFVSEETTTRWAEGCWSDYRGYPDSVAFIESRCVYGGMKNLADGTKKATLWLSATDDYDDFDEGVRGGDAFSVTIDTTESLIWVDALDNLLIGTTGGVFMTRSSRMDLPLTPDPPPITRQISAYPCSRVKPVKANKALIYVSGRQLRELTYDRNSAMFDSDLTAMCEQITLSPIVNMDVQTNPETIIWTVHSDGDMNAFVYDRENGIMAWSKNPMATTSGVVPDVQSVCVIPDYGSGDDIYIAVNRTITGQSVYYGSDAVTWDDEQVTWKSYPIYIEKFAKRFE